MQKGQTGFVFVCVFNCVSKGTDLVPIELLIPHLHNPPNNWTEHKSTCADCEGSQVHGTSDLLAEHILGARDRAGKKNDSLFTSIAPSWATAQITALELFWTTWAWVTWISIEKTLIEDQQFLWNQACTQVAILYLDFCWWWAWASYIVLQCSIHPTCTRLSNHIVGIIKLTRWWSLEVWKTVEAILLRTWPPLSGDDLFQTLCADGGVIMTQWHQKM